MFPLGLEAIILTVKTFSLDHQPLSPAPVRLHAGGGLYSRGLTITICDVILKKRKGRYMQKEELLQKNKTFAESRRSMLGGTDVPAILGLSPYRTPLDVYSSKVNPPEVREDMHPKLVAGIILEDAIAELFEYYSGRKTHKLEQTVFHTEYDFMGANVDRIIEPGQNDEYEGILDCKNKEGWVVESYKAKGDEVLVNDWCQVQHYMDILKKDYAYLAVLIDGNDLEYHRVERDADFIEHKNKVLLKFWKDHILKKIPPEASTPQELITTNYKFDEDNIIEASDNVAGIVLEYQEWGNKEQAARERKKEIADQLKMLLKDAGQLHYNGTPIMSMRKITRTGVKNKELKEQYPEIYERLKDETSYYQLYPRKNIEI